MVASSLSDVQNALRNANSSPSELFEVLHKCNVGSLPIGTFENKYTLEWRIHSGALPLAGFPCSTDEEHPVTVIYPSSILLTTKDRTLRPRCPGKVYPAGSVTITAMDGTVCSEDFALAFDAANNEPWLIYKVGTVDDISLTFHKTSSGYRFGHLFSAQNKQTQGISWAKITLSKNANLISGPINGKKKLRLIARKSQDSNSLILVLSPMRCQNCKSRLKRARLVGAVDQSRGDAYIRRQIPQSPLNCSYVEMNDA